jgi:hypothetical protein
MQNKDFMAPGKIQLSYMQERAGLQGCNGLKVTLESRRCPCNPDPRHGGTVSDYR